LDYKNKISAKPAYSLIAYSVSKQGIVTCFTTLCYVPGAPTRSSQIVGNRHQSSSNTTGSSLHGHGSTVSSTSLITDDDINYTVVLQRTIFAALLSVYSFYG